MNLLSRLLAAILGHDEVSRETFSDALIVWCRCGSYTIYTIEVHDPGTWRQREHHEFMCTTCPREKRNRRLIAKRFAAMLPTARLIR